MTAANRAEVERQRKAKEDERRKKQQKLRARERGEDTDSDDDDDDDEVAADTEWDDLASEDMLTGIHSSMQGPFPFHVGDGPNRRSALGDNRSERVCRHARGASVGGWPHRRTSRAIRGGRICRRARGRKGGGPLCPGAGGRLKTVPPR